MKQFMDETSLKCSIYKITVGLDGSFIFESREKRTQLKDSKDTVEI